MHLNPYKSPSHTIPPKKLSGSARAVRVGVTLFGVGIIIYGCCFVGFHLLTHEGRPPFWLQVVVCTAMALVPLGFLIAAIGGTVWLLGKLFK
jgi:hypothetical protein